MAVNYIDVQYDPSHDTTIDNQDLFQYDRGQAIRLNGFSGFARPIEVHFANSKHGRASTYICEEDIIAIPDQYLMSGRDIYVWLYLTMLKETEDEDGNIVTTTSGKTVYTLELPVKRRAGIAGLSPTPSEKTAIEKLFDAISDIVEKVDKIDDFFDDGIIIFEGMNAVERNELENTSIVYEGMNAEERNDALNGNI